MNHEKEQRQMEAQTNINALTEYYQKISEKSGLATDFSRTRVEGFKEMGKRELQKAAGSGTMHTDSPIKAAGAHSPRNPNVTNPNTGKPFEFVTGRKPTFQQDHTIAGYGCKTGRKIDEVDDLADFYATPDYEKWQKEKAVYWVYDEYGEERQVELHWYQHPDIGKVEYKAKEKGGRIYIDEWRN